MTRTPLALADARLEGRERRAAGERRTLGAVADDPLRQALTRLRANRPLRGTPGFGAAPPTTEVSGGHCCCHGGVATGNESALRMLTPGRAGPELEGSPRVAGAPSRSDRTQRLTDANPIP